MRYVPGLRDMLIDTTQVHQTENMSACTSRLRSTKAQKILKLKNSRHLQIYSLALARAIFQMDMKGISYPSQRQRPSFLWITDSYTHLFFIIQKFFLITNRNPHQSVQFSHSVMSDSLWPHESQHTRPPCPSQAPRVYSNSCPSSRWCHPAISSSVIPFSSCPQSLPAPGSFPMSQLFAETLIVEIKYLSFYSMPLSCYYP